MMTTVLTAAISLLASAVAAQTPEQVATYRDWIVYSAEVGGDTICYAVTKPTDQDPSSVDHGDVFFTVATWKSGRASEQPSFMAGYELRTEPEPLVRVGSDRWSMYTSEDESFVESDSDEDRLVSAMRRGSEMRVSAMSARGTNTEYTFSLLGVSNALDRARAACR